MYLLTAQAEVRVLPGEQRPSRTGPFIVNTKEGEFYFGFFHVGTH